jgi:hypothetical protein
MFSGHPARLCVTDPKNSVNTKRTENEKNRCDDTDISLPDKLSGNEIPTNPSQTRGVTGGFYSNLPPISRFFYTLSDKTINI